jgi:class 3 adenylate cyclase/tetratricopeptide (TPR) repeat protein
VAERRVVSILFVDLVGFTSLAEDRDAEDTRELLSRYFDLSNEVISRYGGTVEKFIGDAVMAVWGAPTAHEDDAERAVRAALDLVDAVVSLGTVQARAGVMTGEAAVTIGATNQGMVAGDLVNTASRLQSVAQPGSVLVGEATQRAASMAIVFEEAGERMLKGRASPVMAWRAVRVVAERGGRNRAETLEAPFVGRDEELRLLKDLFHATTRDRRARLVSVVGPAGIGKTRLAWEFLKYVDGLVETAWWHNGRSPAYGEGISFWALGEMVRERCRLLETDDEPITRIKVAETLATHVPDPKEQRWIEPALLALLGIETGIGSEQLFGAWRTFFERLAATAPVVMVFEDHHYADTGLLDFVDHLLQWSRNVPIYVVTLARPELLEKRPTWGAGQRNFTSLFLEPLSERAMGELLAGLVPGLPGHAVATIVERAGGIPLYAVETVRMLVSEGRISLADGVYHPIGDLVNLAVPETLAALIASRLDGLARRDRALVSDAAVLGQTFTLPGLSAVSGIDEAELEPRLLELVQRELLTLEADPRSPERGQYGFVQALIREVAYNTLAKKDRKSRHLAAARFFESLEMSEIAGGLAGHYFAAYENAIAGPEADALAGQARVALRAAAERAVVLGAHDEAVTFLDQALTITSDSADRAELLERSGESASAAGRHQAAQEHLRLALSIRRDLGDRRAIARATTLLGSALSSDFQTRDAVAMLGPAGEEFADLASDPTVIALGGQFARALFLNSEMDRAIAVADRVLGAAEHADLRAVVADTLVTKGTALGWVGRVSEGLALLAGGQTIAEAEGLASVAIRAMSNRSSIEASGDPRAAVETCREGLALARRLGRRSMAAILLSNGAESALRTGDWSWAFNELEAFLADDLEPTERAHFLSAWITLGAPAGRHPAAALAELKRIVGASSDPQLLVIVQLAVALDAFASGRLGEAHFAWHRAAELSVEYVPVSLARAARAALWLGENDEAGADLAALSASGVHGPAIQADEATIRAGIAAAEGYPDKALPLYGDALRAWRHLGLGWDEALCGFDMALLLDRDEPDVGAASAGARDLFTRLGASPLIEQLEAALERQQSAARLARSRSRDASSV